MINQGTMVPYQIGLDTVQAEVLGTVRDGAQYLLMVKYYVPHEETGQPQLIRRLIQRDVKFIEGLYADSRCNNTYRDECNRSHKYVRLSFLDTGIESGERGTIRYPEGYYDAHSWE